MSRVSPEKDLPIPTSKEAAIAERNNWVESAMRFSSNESYYRGLLDQIADHIGVKAFTSDDGVVHDSPMRAKLPELIASLIPKGPHVSLQ